MKASGEEILAGETPAYLTGWKPALREPGVWNE